MPLDNPHIQPDHAFVPVTATPSAPPLSVPPIGFKATPGGIDIVADGGSTTWLCSPIKVISTFHDVLGKGWGRLVELVDANGTVHQIPLSDADITSKWSGVVRRLIDAGLRINVAPSSKKALQRMILSWCPVKQQISTSDPGWVGDDRKAFVTGAGKVIGGLDVLPVDLRTSPSSAAQVDRGTLPEWREEVGRLCSGNEILTLAVSTALSGPMLDFLDLDLGGGLHLQGASSQGKSTALRVATSVFGSPKATCSWRATANGLEALAASLNGTFLPLDELGEIEGRQLHDILYSLANGVGKSRMSNGHSPDGTKRWKVSILSTGEITISRKLAEAGRKQMPGQMVRLVDVTADNQRFGAFDDLHGAPDAAAFADRLKHATSTLHGTAGVAFVQELIRRTDQREKLRSMVHKLAKTFVIDLGQGNSAVAQRVAERFALIAISGELATKYGITGWQHGAATAAAKRTFIRWHEALTGRAVEVLAPVVSVINDFYKRHKPQIHPLGLPQGSVGISIAWEDDHFLYFPAETWQAMFPDASGRAAAIPLKESGVLRSGAGENLMRKASNGNGRRQRYYTLHKHRLSLGSDE